MSQSALDVSSDTVNVLMDVSILYVIGILAWWLLLHAIYAPSAVFTRTVSGAIAAVMFLVSFFLTYRVVHRTGEYHKALALLVLLNVAAAHTAGVFFGRWMYLPTEDDLAKMSDEEKKKASSSLSKTSLIGVCISLGIGILLLLVVCVWTASIVSSLSSSSSTSHIELQPVSK